jgi:hypothetical protein
MGEKLDEGLELALVQMPQPLPVFLGDYLVEPVDELAPAIR